MVEEISEPALTALEVSPVWAGLPRRVDNQLKNCVQADRAVRGFPQRDLLAVTGALCAGRRGPVADDGDARRPVYPRRQPVRRRPA
ncbi:MAG: hypothetical protein ACLT8E_10855 [Akkermansia sp.]